MRSEYDWGSLNKLQIGKYAEYIVKMEFTRLGLDVYSAEVDDKGIDFVVRAGADRYFDVQVKSVRNWGLITLPRAKGFERRRNLLLAVVVYVDHRAPEIFLVPSMKFPSKPNQGDLLFYYLGPHGDRQKRFDEYQVKMGKVYREKLRRRYAFERVARTLLRRTSH